MTSDNAQDNARAELSKARVALQAAAEGFAEEMQRAEALFALLEGFLAQRGVVGTH